MNRNELTPSEELRRELTGKTDFQFQIGNLAVSKRVLHRTEDESFDDFVWDSFARHCICDWGDIDEEARKANDQAIKEGGYLLSEYEHIKYSKLYIFTQIDRSETVVCLPDEFEVTNF